MSILAAGILALLCAAGRAADCMPRFPFQEGWLGGDAAYSVALSSGRSAWFFGDTFVGKPGASDRRDAKLVANSMAISTCAGGRWGITYYWTEDRPNAPRAFFDPRHGAGKLWPLDGFTHDGRLYLALSRIRPVSKKGPLGFEGTGVFLARVDNPQDDPRRWLITYRKLASGKTVFPGVSAVVRGGHVYLFAVLDDAGHKSHPIILTRVPLDRLDQPGAAIERLARDGAWKPGLDWRDAAVVMEQGATELSVRWHAGLKRWVALMVKPGFGASEVIVRTALELSGPWSPDRAVFRFPEMQKGVPGYDQDTFCYAAKEQAQFRGSSGRALMTYACNSFDFDKLVSGRDLYRPQAVFVYAAPQD